MSAKIITDTKKLTREQVIRPSSNDLEEVARKTYDISFAVARGVRRATVLDDTPYFRRFIAASIEGISNKLRAIKRIGYKYIPEAGSILRDLTEVVVDFFWVASHFEHKKGDAEQISHQFFLSHNKQFLAQAHQALIAMRDDIFLGEFVSEDVWQENVTKAKQELKGAKTGKKWRIIAGMQPSQCKWDSRCKRAAKIAEKMVNLKYAPYYQNLQTLSSYTHWDSPQTQQLEGEFAKALFDRSFNNAIGFNHDVITGACELSGIQVPNECILLRQRFVYMST